MMDETLQVTAERLRALREEKGIKRQQLADDLGITRASLEYYEKGKRKPNIEMIAKIANRFNISVDYLLGITDIRTTEKGLRYVCNYTGLSPITVRQIQLITHDPTLKKLLEHIINGLEEYELR